MEAMVCDYYKIWCILLEISGQQLTCIAIHLIELAITMATPTANCTQVSGEDLCVGLYFTDLVFAVCQSSSKLPSIW